jgi:hypothetical protein
MGIAVIYIACHPHCSRSLRRRWPGRLRGTNRGLGVICATAHSRVQGSSPGRLRKRPPAPPDVSKYENLLRCLVHICAYLEIAVVYAGACRHVTPAFRKFGALVNAARANSSVGHRHHIAVDIGDDPDRAGDDEKDDQHAKGEGQNIIRAVGAAAEMQEKDEVDADLR